MIAAIGFFLPSLEVARGVGMEALGLEPFYFPAEVAVLAAILVPIVCVALMKTRVWVRALTICVIPFAVLEQVLALALISLCWSGLSGLQ